MPAGNPHGASMKLFISGILLSLASLLISGAAISINDPDGSLGATRAPVTALVKLSHRQERAAEEGRLFLREDTGRVRTFVAITAPAQLMQSESSAKGQRICWQMPPGAPGTRRFKLEIIPQTKDPIMAAEWDTASGQFDITDEEQPALRYNYATIEPGDIVTNVAPASRIYAVARSDYIHPLFGLDSEILTKDWSVDHPHHRGIYWAWPEVDWRGQRGDLHALQHVFAKPTGRCITTGGQVFAQIEADNVWKWKTGEALVREKAVIRLYHATGDDRLVDLEFCFTALQEPVLLARRGTDKYGGLNIRLAKVAEQEIIFHTDPTNATPRLAWAELSGKFGDATKPSGIVVIQNTANPDYPGDWVKFPDLNWFQPTFPATGARYELKPGQPLVLRFRLWLHRGAKADEARCAVQARAYLSPVTPKFFPKH